MRRRQLLLLGLFLSCGPTGEPVSDAGLDAGLAVDAGIDAGPGPVTLDFLQYAPPAALIRSALVSDGDAVFTASSVNVEVSTDVGRTWEKRAVMSGQLALVGSDTVYVLKQSAQLWRSDDAARTFTQVGFPATVTSTSSPLLSTRARRWWRAAGG